MSRNEEKRPMRKIETSKMKQNKVIINVESEPVRKVVGPSLACWSFCERLWCDEDDDGDDLDDRWKSDI